MGGVAVNAGKHLFNSFGGLCIVRVRENQPCNQPRDHEVHIQSPLQGVAASIGRAFGVQPVVAPEAVIAFTAHADATLALVREKDKAYGGAWQKQGYMGNLSRIMSKTARLENMMWRDGGPDVSVAMDGSDADPGTEHVLETLHDLMALCAFMASNIEEGNKWGS